MKRLVALILGSSLALSAHAHTKLAKSTPEPDTTVAAPKTLELTFGGDVRLTSVTLADAGGREVHLDAVPTAVASRFELAIHAGLQPGRYTVVWRAVGGDTHIVSGEFAFTVAAP
jgi:methionine-rich copper-binding protein CopC